MVSLWYIDVTFNLTLDNQTIELCPSSNEVGISLSHNTIHVLYISAETISS